MIDIEISLDKLLAQVFSLEIEEDKIRIDLGEVGVKLSIQKELFEEREQEKLKLKQMIREFVSFSWITIAVNKITFIWKPRRIHRCSTQTQLANKLRPNPFEETTDTAKVPFDKEAEIKSRLAAMAKGKGASFHLWD